MSKRIILFGPLPPPHGGVAIYMKALVAHFRGPNIRVWTYTGQKLKGAKVRFVAHRRLGTLWALIAEGRNARILDASHFHLEYPNPLLLPVWIVLKWLVGFEWFKNVLDGSLPKRYPQFGRVQRWLFHRAVNAVDEFVVVSEDLRRWLQEDLKLRQSITVIPCLLPTPLGETITTLSSETAKSLEPYLSHGKRVCSIGVFFPSYGFKDVAEAVEELRKRTGKDIGLLLLDGGFVRDENYRDEVLWGRDWITVLEKVPNPEIYQVLKRSDVFVRAFADESYGISRIEALWCGIPVVATRAGETRGMLLYDFGDVEQLIRQLQAVLLYPVLEETNPWAARYRREAEENLKAVARVLGIEDTGE
jgi:glycosyltransferase involved in cell wall biosynthesis